MTSSPVISLIVLIDQTPDQSQASVIADAQSRRIRLLGDADKVPLRIIDNQRLFGQGKVDAQRVGQTGAPTLLDDFERDVMAS
jgi:hypothetical protein